MHENTRINKKLLLPNVSCTFRENICNLSQSGEVLIILPRQLMAHEDDHMKTTILEAGLFIIKGESTGLPPQCEIQWRDNLLPEFRQARFSLLTPGGRRAFGVAIQDIEDEDKIVISMYTR